MHLVVYELDTGGITQEIEIGDRSIRVAAMRPHVYKHAVPSGSIKLEIKTLLDVVVAESDPVSIAYLDSQTGPYFHGPVEFNIDAALQKNTKYKVVMTGFGGYTFSESAYIGWCGGYDLKVVQDSFTPISDLDNGLILEIWEHKKISKGNY